MLALFGSAVDGEDWSICAPGVVAAAAVAVNAIAVAATQSTDRTHFEFFMLFVPPKDGAPQD